MAINPLIALQQNSVDTATPTANLLNIMQKDKENDRQAKIDEQNAQLRELQIANEEFKQQEMQEQSRRKSIVFGAAEINPLLKSGDIEGARVILNNRLSNLQAQGKDTTDTEEALQLLDSDPEALLNTTDSAIQYGQSIGLIKGDKLTDKFEDIKDEKGNVIGQRNVATQEIQEVSLGDRKGGGMYSAKTEIFDDGTTIQAAPDGSVVVKNPEGKIVTGEERRETLKQSLADRATQKGAESRSSEIAKTNIQLSKDSLDQLKPVNETIANINEAIAAIDSGANTGPIMSRLPSFNSASILLDNLQAKLGLNVIANTTFGALSKGELDLALSTAVPSNLDEKDLRDWLIKKRDAQEKLANYVEDAAIYFSTEGASIDKWLEMQKGRKTEGDESKPASEMSDDELFQ